MQPQKLNSSQDVTDEARRSIHDIAAAIISVRALAETLAEHVPTLVAMSRLRHATKTAQIRSETLDALPSIPTEIVGLCEIAREALQKLGNRAATSDETGVPSTFGLLPTASDWDDSSPEDSDGAGARILLVEDEDTVRYVLSQTLYAHGCQVTSASDGEEALRLLEEKEFELVLMDLRIPGMSGWETAEQLRKKEAAQGRYTRIVGLTASPLLEDQRHARAAGMDDVLVKPIDETALKAVLDRYT